jgi:2-(1,2-epoxy-1,2-dihydrophenyl)acetyl-CoA isomerase
MPYKALILEKEDRIATITLNRPDAGNSFDFTLLQEIDHVFGEVVRDPEVRAIIVTGAGKHFCTGIDLTMFAGAGGADAQQTGESDTAPSGEDQTYGKGTNIGATIRMRETDKPVIAAVNGSAIGAGFALALSCDMRIASDRAKFSSVFVRRGVGPDAGASFTLPRIVGFPRACELLLSGRTVDAAEADRIGLLIRLVPHDDLMSAARELAESIAKNPPLAVARTKAAVYRAVAETDIVAHMKYEVEIQDELLATEDFMEAATAFMEKREPVFKGR